jgi:hypothetical protein
VSRVDLPVGYFRVAATYAMFRHKADELWPASVVGINPLEARNNTSASVRCEVAAEAIEDALVALKELVDDRDAADTLARITGTEVAA